MRFTILAVLVSMLAGCGSSPATTEETLTSRTVTLPGGQKIISEIKTRPEDMARGMMFRDSMEPDHGMLFIHQQPGQYPYWMFHCRIPLDIIWMDAERRIVEISANTPPCKAAASQCPSYGGHKPSLFVLELGGGMASKYGLKEGDRLDF